ncbi:endonuclease/exonuclease/phosphatase family protein [Zavarzinella formosa]|uniref:endonuclease/exonuclease/phosphatase family protein n=1 Tax=Zavarzinella formosa TaxID=360055 RepID=UPI00030CA7B0|nr:endonuclease/exonuclease/phosphatase family protein [Zavarzinella formosa]
MVSFGFWNVDSLRNTSKDEREIARLAAELAVERSLDILFLIECGIPVPALLAAFDQGPEYHAISCGNRFKVVARFNPKCLARLSLPVSNDRFDVWQLQLPLQQEILVSVVHGLDKRNNSPEKQGLFLQQVAATIAYFETQIGHDRSIVLGDFNANPFESSVASVLGMNAVASRSIASDEPRQMFGRSYPYFYNPMWNLFGDEPRGTSPGTYYYRGSNPHELYMAYVRPSGDSSVFAQQLFFRRI